MTWTLLKTAPAVAAACVVSLAGPALAEDAAPAQESQLPSLPTPPEVVRNLSEQLLGSPPDSLDAPPLKDDGSSNGGSTERPEDRERDAELQQRFEKTILPKIKGQLQALDQNENPNTTIIELKRQLRRVEDDIERLLADLKEGKSDAAHAEASGLQKEFYDIRDFVKKNGGQLTDEAGG